MMTIFRGPRWLVEQWAERFFEHFASSDEPSEPLSAFPLSPLLDLPTPK